MEGHAGFDDPVSSRLPMSWGKYYARYKEGTNVVLLAPDIAEVFRDSTSVNAALRQFLAEHGAPSAKTAG